MATFGKTTIGANTNDQATERIRACRFQLTEAGTVTKISAYLRAGEGSVTVYAAIYDDSDGVPNRLKASSGAVTVGEFAWYDFPLNVTLPPGFYWLCFRAPTIYWRYDAGEANQETYKMTNTFPDPFGMPDGYTNNANSIYAEYIPVETRNLTIQATEGGTTDPTPGVYPQPKGYKVQVTAIPSTGYVFDHWELDGVNIGSVNPVSVTMDVDHTILAVFVAIPRHTLTVKSSPVQGIPFTIERV